MGYLDNLILEKREQMKRETYTTLEEGMYLDGKVVHFERQELLGAFSIMLPDIWRKMPIEYARIKYPSEFRPKSIMTTADLSVNMGFTAFPKEVHSDDIEKLAERIRSVIHRSYPNYILYACEVLPEIKGCWFSFRSHAMDSDLYNMMLTAPVGKRVVQGSFNCPYKDYPNWKKAVLEIWKSIKEAKGA